MSMDNRGGHRPSGTMANLSISLFLSSTHSPFRSLCLSCSLSSSLSSSLYLFLSMQSESGPRGASREREGGLSQEKGGPSVPAHILGNPYAFGLSPGAVMQDSRFQPLK